MTLDPGMGRVTLDASASPDATARVRELQDDLRVLVEHVAGRVDGAPAPSTSQAAFLPGLSAAAGLLTTSAEAVARDAELLGQLYASLAALTVLVAPANVRSIRLTRAFVHGTGLDNPQSSVAGEARRLTRWAWASAFFGLLVFLCAIVLLVHVDRGRRAIQQLELVQKEYQTAAGSLDVARTASVTASNGGGADFECRAVDSTNPASPAPQGAAGTRQQRLLCNQLQTSIERMRIVRDELRIWNVISDRLSFISPVTWLSPAGVGGMSTGAWEASELRTSVMMAALTGFVMPMLLGLLGACVYVYREIDNQIRTSTLEARQAVHGTLRMLLGAILGGMLGAIWTNGQAVQLEGVSLSLGALAFFVGFSVEIVFSVVDSLVRAVAGRVSNRPA